MSGYGAPVARASETWSGGGYLLGAVAVGLLAGVLTQVGQGILPDGWRSLANSITPWLLVAFLIGSRSPGPGWAVAAGPVTLLAALAAYYVTVAVRLGIVSSLSGAMTLWIIAAVVGGPVFALAGRWWRDARPWHRAFAAGLMGAAAVAEGAYIAIVLDERAVGLVAVGIGVALPILLGRVRGDRLRGLVMLGPCVLLGLAGFGATIALYGFLTG